MNKSKITKLATYVCEHSHNFANHPNCFFKDDDQIGRKEKIGILDLETFTLNFRADLGVVLSYTIKELDGEMKSNWVTSKELHQSGKRDLRLLKDLIKDMKQFDRLVGHNLERFDCRLSRARAVHYGLDYPIYKEIFSTDTLLIMWKKFNLKSASLKNACQFFNIPAKDTPFEIELWLDAVQGNKKAMEEVVRHCEEDVVATETLFKKISTFVPISRKSI
jgi:uncharacterized protein YprB with RNaseH-like and TPR domain